MIQKYLLLGGEMLYKHVLEEYIININKLYITEIYSSVECDRFFPKIDNEIFKIKEVSKFKKENDMFFRYFIYEKRINNIVNSIVNKTDNYINEEELNYKNMIKNILENGLVRDDRTGVGTISVFAPCSMKYDFRGYISVMYFETWVFFEQYLKN